jgi:prophage DNA circulation protein
MATLDVLSTLQPPSWRGIPFPLTSLHNGFTHDHVEHKFLYQSGAYIEATGRNALNFQARIPFCNGVEAASFESWAGQVLYPDLFNRFLQAVLDETSGEFVHPNFGTLTCKARDVDWDIAGNGPRDGAILSCRFYHSNDDKDSLSDTLTTQSPMARASSSAAVLDDQLAATGPLPELSNDKKSFGELVADVGDGTGNVGRITSKLDNTDAALQRRDSVGDWPLRGAVEDMRAAVFDLQSFNGVGAQRTRETTVSWGTTLPVLGIRLGVRTQDLVEMNPSLARSPLVPAGVRVRYPFGAR